MRSGRVSRVVGVYSTASMLFLTIRSARSVRSLASACFRCAVGSGVSLSTLEFLRRCRANMSPDGIIVMQIGVSDTYLGGAAGRLLTTLATTVREVFPQIAAIPGSEITLVAGGTDSLVDLDVDRLTERLFERGLDSSELIPEMIPLFVDPDRAAALAPWLAGRGTGQNHHEGDDRATGQQLARSHGSSSSIHLGS